MNCFLCHLPEPDNEARLGALHDGQFQWANTATLLGSGIVQQDGDQWSWNAEAFDSNGELAPLNNPVYFQESDESQPDHLTFDPRRIDHGEYLYRSLHQFAKGESARGTVNPELDNTQRRCESCHSIEKTHDWLPYKERHMESVNCESCHIPEM
jgi:hypothetical protein